MELKEDNLLKEKTGTSSLIIKFRLGDRRAYFYQDFSRIVEL